MRRITVLLPLLLILGVAGMTALPVSGQSGFIIQHADEVNSLSLDTPSSGLRDLMDQTVPRFVIRHAHANAYTVLHPLPTVLSDLLAGMEPRFVLQHAHANRFRALTPIPAELHTRLDEILPRFVLQFAHAARQVPLRYPVALIGDTTPPRLSDIDVTGFGEDGARVTWTTDEYADSTVRCGPSSGTYTMTFFNPLYVKEHAITLTGLTPGTTYYCRVSSTDLSGNTAHSQEFIFEPGGETSVYLPLVLRNP